MHDVAVSSTEAGDPSPVVSVVYRRIRLALSAPFTDEFSTLANSLWGEVPDVLTARAFRRAGDPWTTVVLTLDMAADGIVADRVASDLRANSLVREAEVLEDLAAIWPDAAFLGSPAAVADPVLYSTFVLTLFVHDLMGINFEFNADEYEPEVRTILPRLGPDSSVDEVCRIVREKFDRWFSSPDIAPERYERLAEDLWRLWKRVG